MRVNPPGLQVRSRSGYWAPDAAEQERAMAKVAEVPAVPEPVLRAFGELARLESPGTGDDSGVQTIVQPDSPGDALLVGAPQLWRVRRPAEVAAARGDDPPTPTPIRTFTRSDRLIVRFTVSGDLASGAEVSARLLGRGGARLIDLPLVRSADGRWILDLALASIARGDYVIAIETAAGDSRAAAYVPFRIKAG